MIPFDLSVGADNLTAVPISHLTLTSFFLTLLHGTLSDLSTDICPPPPPLPPLRFQARWSVSSAAAATLNWTTSNYTLSSTPPWRNTRASSVRSARTTPLN